MLRRSRRRNGATHIVPGAVLVTIAQDPRYHTPYLLHSAFFKFHSKVLGGTQDNELQNGVESGSDSRRLD